MHDPIRQILRELIADADVENSRALADIGDSFDMLALRTALAEQLGPISDERWLSVRTVGELCHVYAGNAAHVSTTHERSPARLARHYNVNMPHMAAGGLSEAWLFRELGDMHWSCLCEALGARSDAIVDEGGNRLYATFVRIRWDGALDLKGVRENDGLDIEACGSRFGRSMFFSEVVVNGARGARARAKLMSTFARRGKSNKALLKGEPIIPADAGIEVLNAMPQFGAEYRAMRGGAGVDEIDGVCLTLGETLFEIEHRINPYQDFNGVNLLYFAAYPAIADACERAFMHGDKTARGIRLDWALQSATVARDVFYYGNCDIDDVIVYRLRALQQRPGQQAFGASMHRRSDGQALADVFTVKAHHDD